jgi:choline dehydrogenase
MSDRTFDYVIVGAGSAGCVLANRLTEDPGARVLLLEAGPHDDCDEVRIPAAFYRLFKTQRDWAYETEEEKQLQGRRLFWPRGRMLGGSSSINAMIYIRGNRLDYDTWRDEYGCTGWGYADLLPYFRRAEDQARGASPYHGVGGPLRVEDLRHVHELSRAFLAAAVAWGMPPNEDFNGSGQDGAGQYQVTQRRGRRWSTADAYLRPAMRRPNLTVLTDALAARVVVERGRAVGVTYRHRGAEHTARADGEVVLAGGAVNSPQLLLLSGIGPATHLAEVGVDVLVDLPGVGANLHDHPVVPVLWFTQGTDDLYSAENLGGMLQWLVARRGKFTSNVAETGAFLRTRDGLPAPDVQFHVAPAMFINHGMTEPPGMGFSIGPTLVDVASRGRLTLRSADPRVPPVLQPNYLDVGSDLESLVAGVTIAREVAEQAPLRRFLRSEYLPGPGVRTADELREYVRTSAETLYHPVGTCAMGTGDEAVVDSELRVRGVDGLRVVDASVMPLVPRGNTNAPTIALAERASDLIRGRSPLAAAAPDVLTAGGTR